MEFKKPITVVVTTDEHYMVLLAALIKSIEKSSSHKNPIHLFIIADRIKKKAKEQLEQSINQNIIAVYWKNMEDIIPAWFKIPRDWTSYPTNIYMRLLIPYFLNENIDRVLYLDVDMIVRKDIAALFETNMNGQIVAAVRDQRVLTFGNSWGGIKNYAAMGLSANLPYFNTGLLLIDLKKWIDFDVTKKVVECIEHYKYFANYPDQYGLNVVLVDNWMELDPKWNCFSSGLEPHPYIIHFVDRKPIFTTYKGNPLYKDIFFGYLNSTQWKEATLVGEIVRFKKKLKNIIGKLKNTVFPSGN